MNAKAQLLSVMPTADNLDLIVLAAASGDASTVRQLLQQHPEEVFIYTSNCLFFCGKLYTCV